MKKRFAITIDISGELEIDEEVLNGIDDNWRKQMFDFKTTRDVVSYIASAMILDGSSLSQVDGFADRKDTDASVKWVISGVDVKNLSMSMNSRYSEKAE